MERKIQIKGIEIPISTRYISSDKAFCLIIIAHGAGNDINSDFIKLVQNHLIKRDIASFSFNFVYKENGKKLPGNKKKLEVEYNAVYNYVKNNFSDLPLFLGGKSMGARVSTKIINNLPDVKGLIFLGFPIHSPSRPDKLVGDYIYEINLPMLFLQGTRDAFSQKEAIEKFIPKLRNAELHWLEGGDHSWKTNKKALKNQDELIKEASEVIFSFCKKQLS